MSTKETQEGEAKVTGQRYESKERESPYPRPNLCSKCAWPGGVEVCPMCRFRKTQERIAALVVVLGVLGTCVIIGGVRQMDVALLFIGLASILLFVISIFALMLHAFDDPRLRRRDSRKINDGK